MKEKILQLDKRLRKKFGIPERSKTPPDPVNLLIATILSQNTNDNNSFKAYKNLKEKYPDWEEVSNLRSNQIEKLIRVAGLGKQKSKAIKNLLTSLLKERDNISLEHLRQMNNNDVLNELTGYPGIGVKTASCVLLFSLMRDVCPVDTHVHRTLNRIGLVNTKTPDKTFSAINNNFPKGKAHSFHTNLIRLGREICKPAHPECKRCPVADICLFKYKTTDEKYLNRKKSFMLLDNV